MEMQLAWSGSKTRFSGSHSSRSAFSLACKMIPFELLNSVSPSWQLLLSGARHSGHLLRPSHNNRMRELVHRFRQLHDSWFSATFLFLASTSNPDISNSLGEAFCERVGGNCEEEDTGLYQAEDQSLRGFIVPSPQDSSPRPRTKIDLVLPPLIAFRAPGKYCLNI